MQFTQMGLEEIMNCVASIFLVFPSLKISQACNLYIFVSIGYILVHVSPIRLEQSLFLICTTTRAEGQFLTQKLTKEGR